MLILTGCIISENKVCRDQLSSTIRQINSTFKSYEDNKQAEQNLNMLRVSDFYSDYTGQFGSIRNELAKVSITKKFHEYSLILDEVISESSDYFNNRASLISDVFTLSSNVDDLNYDMDKCLERKRFLDHMQKKYSSLNHNFHSNDDEYMKYKGDVLFGISDIVDTYAQFAENIERYENNKGKLAQLSDSINVLNFEVGVADNLSFYDIVSDENDYINTLDTTYYSQYIKNLVELLPEL